MWVLLPTECLLRMLKSSSSTTCVTLSLHTSSLHTASAATMTGRESERVHEVAKQLARSKSFQQQKRVNVLPVREESQSNHGSTANINLESNSSLPRNGVASGKRFKIKDSTKLALKLHVIHEKGLRIEQLLMHLQLATAECGMGERGDGREHFVSTAVEVEHEVRLTKKLMLLLCSHRLLEEHFSTLMSVPEQMRPTFDISVKFFGMNWEHAFRVTANLLHLVKAMLSSLRREIGAPSANSEEFRLVYPSNILRDLATLEADVMAHTEAVLKNRLATLPSEDMRGVVHNPVEVEPRSSVIVVVNDEEEINEEDSCVKERLKTSKRKNRETRSSPEEVNDVSDDVEEEKGTQRTGNRLLNLLRALQLRFKRRKKKTSHDDLWRMWYLGVQNMTLSVSVNTSEEGQNNEGPSELKPASTPSLLPKRRMSTLMECESRSECAKDDLCLVRPISRRPKRRSSVC